jgi:hypothetical protein
LDLNSDSKPDEIKYSCTDSTWKLTINSSSVTGVGENILKKFAICDINTNDKTKEIMISENGPSDDLSTKYYLYNGTAIVYLGTTSGTFEHGIKINGSKSFTALTRGKILQTWFFDKTYRLNINTIEEVPQDLYKTNYEVTTKKPIKLYTGKSTTSSTFDVAKGTKLTIIATDDKEYCQLQSHDGKKGWIAIRHYSTIVNNGEEANNVFDGLCNAD